MVVAEKCIICGLKSTRWWPKVGKNERITSQTKNSSKYGSVFSAWNEECATALCQILFHSSNHLYLNYFQENFAYCSSCQQTVRDINFTWKQISSLQRRLNYLSNVVKRRLHSNFLCVAQNEVKGTVNEEEEAISDGNKINARSSGDEEHDSNPYNNVVKLIYEAATQGCEMDSLSSHKDSNCSEEQPKRSVSSAGNCNIKNIKVEVDVFQDHDDLAENCCEGQTSLTFENRPKRKSASAALLTFKSRNRSDSENESISNNSNGSIFDSDCSENEAAIKYSNHEDDDASLLENKEHIKTEKKPIIKKIKTEKKSRSKKIKTESIKIAKGKSKDPEILNAKKIRARERKNALRRVWRQLKRSNVKRHTFDCTVEGCKARLKNEEALQNHIKASHSGEKKPFECPKCLKRFTRPFTLKKHNEDVHGGPKGYDHCCKFCGQGYQEENELQAHYASSHLGSNPFSCAFCDKICTNGSFLRIHMKFDHPDEDKPLCSVCGKKFSSKVTLAAHSRYHADPESLFKCTICTFVTISASALKIHVERHSTEKKYTCEVCGKSFTNKPSLRSHSYVHAAKNYKCKVCDMAFPNKERLGRHEVTHAGIKEHVCETCGRAFTHRKNLKDHEKIHLRDSGIDIPMRKQRSKKEKINQQIPIGETQYQPFFLPVNETYSDMLSHVSDPLEIQFGKTQSISKLI